MFADRWLVVEFSAINDDFPIFAFIGATWRYRNSTHIHKSKMLSVQMNFRKMTSGVLHQGTCIRRYLENGRKGVNKKKKKTMLKRANDSNVQCPGRKSDDKCHINKCIRVYNI